ncbi:SAM-dependent methyltransferase [Capnocytophaga sp. HP1101]
MKIVFLIIFILLFLVFLLYYLVQQSKKPSGFVGVIMMKLFNSVYMPMVQWALEFYKPSKVPRKILDIGVGNGKSTVLLTEYFPHSEVWGIEISEIAIKEAKKLHTRAIFQLEDIRNTSFGDNTFDLITAFQTHFHWQELKEAFLEVKRILSDKGTFLIACEYTKISYYLPKLKKTEDFSHFLNSVGLSLIQEECKQGWVFYKIVNTEYK